MTIPFFDHLRQYNILKKPIGKAIDRVLNSGRLILNEEVENFENNFSSYIGTKFGIGVNSGTDAIKIALRALNIGTGDEVITVSNTAVPTVSAIRELGAIPVFCDIKEDYTINENKIEGLISKKTKAILPVHLYGQAANIPTILKIIKKHKLFLVEDCAQAHGTIINNKKVGSFGDASCFSFYPTKNLGAYGDGGIILTNSKTLAKTCQALRMYGMRKGYYSEIEGFNSRLDEIQAAILNVKLKYLNNWVEKRRQIANKYLTKIINNKIILPKTNTIEHSFHLFVVRVKNRNSFLNYLKENNIGFGIHYPTPIHKQKAYIFLNNKFLKKTEEYSKEIVSLPIFPELTDDEINYIINKINNYNL